MLAVQYGRVPAPYLEEEQMMQPGKQAKGRQDRQAEQRRMERKPDPMWQPDDLVEYMQSVFEDDWQEHVWSWAHNTNKLLDETTIADAAAADAPEDDIVLKARRAWHSWCSTCLPP